MKGRKLARKALYTLLCAAVVPATVIIFRPAPVVGPYAKAERNSILVPGQGAVREVTAPDRALGAVEPLNDVTDFTLQMANSFRPFGVVIPSSSINFIESHPYWFPSRLNDTSYQSNVSTVDSITNSLIKRTAESKFVDTDLLEGQGRILEIDKIAGNTNGSEVRILLDDGASVTLICRDLRPNLPRSSIVNFVGLPLGTLTFVDNSVLSGTVSTLLMDEVTLVQVR